MIRNVTSGVDWLQMTEGDKRQAHTMVNWFTRTVKPLVDRFGSKHLKEVLSTSAADFPFYWTAPFESAVKSTFGELPDPRESSGKALPSMAGAQDFPHHLLNVADIRKALIERVGKARALRGLSILRGMLSGVPMKRMSVPGMSPIEANNFTARYLWPTFFQVASPEAQAAVQKLRRAGGAKPFRPVDPKILQQVFGKLPPPDAPSEGASERFAAKFATDFSRVYYESR
jgi:hypothetical protein